MILVLALALLAAADGQVIRVGVGSCAHQDSAQHVWDAVREWEPDLFVHLGDAVYADTRDSLSMRATYSRGFANPRFRAARKQIPFFAIWDDHDYGSNDAGASYPMRRASQSLFLEFWEEPDSSARVDREGLYDSRVLDEGGSRVQVILLDTRYFRSDWSPDTAGVRRYRQDPDPEKTVLGPEQWAWLASELKQSADLRIIASGIQVINDEHGWECWGNFPRERDRLLRLVQTVSEVPTVFVSGDRHFTELSRDTVDGRPLYDLTASGLTQVAVDGHKVPNSRRVGQAVSVQNFAGIVADFASRAVSFVGVSAQGVLVYQETITFDDLGYRQE